MTLIHSAIVRQGTGRRNQYVVRAHFVTQGPCTFPDMSTLSRVYGEEVPDAFPSPQMKRWRLRKAKQFTQGHTAGWWD